MGFVGNFVAATFETVLSPLSKNDAHVFPVLNFMWFLSCAAALNSVVTVGGGQTFGAVYFNTGGLSFTGGAVTFTIGTYGCAFRSSDFYALESTLQYIENPKESM